jgi:hypothetical protein
MQLTTRRPRSISIELGLTATIQTKQLNFLRAENMSPEFITMVRRIPRSAAARHMPTDPVGHRASCPLGHRPCSLGHRCFCPLDHRPRPRPYLRSPRPASCAATRPRRSTTWRAYRPHAARRARTSRARSMTAPSTLSSWSLPPCVCLPACPRARTADAHASAMRRSLPQRPHTGR